MNTDAEQTSDNSWAADLARKLLAGESPHKLIDSYRPATELETLKRCALTRTFDHDIYGKAIEGPTAGEVLPFLDVIRLPEVEQVPRAVGVYRLREVSRSSYWNAWWNDAETSETPLPPLPPDLREVAGRIAAYCADDGDPVGELAQLALIDPPRAARLFEEHFGAADLVFDLPLCQDLLAALHDVERTPFTDPALIELHESRTAYLKARSHFSVDFLKAGTFYETEGTLETYRDLLAGDRSRVLELHAPGGRGKTMELRWLIARVLVPENSPLDRRKIPGTRIDFDFLEPVNVTNNPWLVLIEIANQLNQQLPGYPFKEFLDSYGWAAPLLRREGADPKSVEAASRRLHTQRARLDKSVPKRFLSTLRSAVPEDIPVVMAFDTLEEVHLRPQGDLDGLVRLLCTLHDRCANVRLILAGRYRVSDRTAERLPAFVTRVPRPFTADDSERYLVRRDIHDHEVRRAVIAKADGVPFKLSLLADLVQQQPSLTPEEISRYEADLIYLVLRVIDRVEDAEVRWILRYGAIARTLDPRFVRRVMEPYLRFAMSGDTRYDNPEHDLLPTALRDDAIAFPTNVLSSRDQPVDIDHCWKRLRSYAGTSSWVTADPNMADVLRIHTEVVNPMRRLIRPHEVHDLLQKAAVDYFEELAGQDRAQRNLWLREAIYHRFQLEGADAACYWRGLIDGIGLNDPEARQELAAEVLGPDYLDSRGRPRTWGDDIPVIAVETVVEARLLLANALTQIARLTKVTAEGPLWSQVEQHLAEIERIHLALGRQVVPERRLAYVRASLELKAERFEDAKRLISDALTLLGPVDEQDVEALHDSIRLNVLLGDVRRSLMDHRAPMSYDAAIAAAARTSAAARRRLEPIINARLIAARRTLGQYDQAEETLAIARRLQVDDDHAADLLVLSVENAISSGQLEKAAAEADPPLRSFVEARRLAAAVIIALARQDPLKARRLLDPRRPHRVDSARTPEPAAWEHELTGLVASALGEYPTATDSLESARTSWQNLGDLDAVVRCNTHSALVQMREVGNLSLAEQHLTEAADLQPAMAEQAWLDLALARAELLVRQGRSEDGLTVVRATIEALQGNHGSARALVRAAVEGLTACSTAQRADLLDVLTDNLRRISPPSARVVALGDLSRVPTPADEAAYGRFRAVRRLLRGYRRELKNTDIALQELTVAEVYRLSGKPGKARMALNMAASYGEELDSAYFVRAWARALDRLSRPIPHSWRGFDRYEQEFAAHPVLLGAFAVERAEAELLRNERLPGVRFLERAARDLDAAGPQDTQWHIRLELVRGEVDRPANGAEARARANAVAARLHNSIEVSPLSSRFADRKVLSHDVALSLRTADTRLDRRSVVNALMNLVNGTREVDEKEASEDIATRLDQNWKDIARALGQLILRDPTHQGGLRAPHDLMVPVGYDKVSMVPWELAYRPGTESLWSLASAARPLYRAISTTAVRRDEVVFVQMALNRLLGTALPLDGDLGPVTAEAVRRYRRTRGLRVNERLSDDLRAHLQQELATDGKPLVVLVHQSPVRQLMAYRGHASAGVDLRRLYRRHGFDVEVVENPTLRGLSRSVEAMIENGRVPAVLHLSGGLRKSNGAIAFSFLARAGDDDSYNDAAEEIPVSSMDHLLSSFPGDGIAPVVVLDVDRPRCRADTALHLLQRNAFAGELFSLGRCAAVLGTGLVGREGGQLYEHLVRSLADGSSLSETIVSLRELAMPAELRDELTLDRVLSFVGVSLFTHLPWLRLTRVRNR